MKEFLLASSKIKTKIKTNISDILEKLKVLEANLLSKLDNFTKERMEYFNRIQDEFLNTNKNFKEFRKNVFKTSLFV